MGWAGGARLVRDIAKRVSKIEGIDHGQQVEIMKAVCAAADDEDWDTHYEAMDTTPALDAALAELYGED